MSRYEPTRDEVNMEALASQRRDESEQNWLNSFMDEAEEIDIELKELKEDLK